VWASSVPRTVDVIYVILLHFFPHDESKSPRQPTDILEAEPELSWRLEVSSLYPLPSVFSKVVAAAGFVSLRNLGLGGFLLRARRTLLPPLPQCGAWSSPDLGKPRSAAHWPWDLDP
jgi:hypothetical protein